MSNKQLVYVKSKNDKPLMPTDNFGYIRLLLKTGKAIPVDNNPFTIKLKYDTEEIIQPLTLGIDPGRENIGIAVTNEKGECLFLCNVQTNNKQVTKAISERAKYRRERRRHHRIRKQRKAIRDNTTIKSGEKNILRNSKSCKSKKTSYPKMDESITQKVIKGKEARFANRKREKGWLTPSANQLVQIHINVVNLIKNLLPISNIVFENNCFDFQKLENMDIRKWEYQTGILYGFKDYKDYINKQQKNTCLLCGQNHINHYHHIVPKSKGGSDTVANIAGLCDECHDLVHKQQEITNKLSELKSGIHKQYEISLLNSCIQVIIDKLNVILPVTSCNGYETYQTRTNLNLEKDHCIDAYCISLYNKKLPENPKSFIKSKTYTIKRFKKKSNNIINKLNKRKYYYNGKLVATNRHKAIEQKENSLEEYINKYKATHTAEEIKQHLKELRVKPAKREYTFHKCNKNITFKCGDIVQYDKSGVVLVVMKVSSSDMSLICNKHKYIKMEYSKLISSNSLVFLN